jgi:hypothetical protein
MSLMMNMLQACTFNLSLLKDQKFKLIIEQDATKPFPGYHFLGPRAEFPIKDTPSKKGIQM